MANYMVIHTEADFKLLIDELLRLASQQPLKMAIDTEFTSKDTYWPIPRLLQLAYNDSVVIVDLKYLRWDSDEAKYFTEVLRHPNIEGIFHSARMDIEIIQQVFGTIPSFPIFDTQIAAKACGYLMSQMGLKDLVRKELAVQMEKTEQKSDWTRANLSKDQLDYAAADVAYLLQIYPKLKEKLGSRLEWLTEEFAKLTDPRRYEQDVDRLWQKLNFPGNLAVQNRFALKLMAIRRDLEARRANLPAPWVIPDADLISLAKCLPKSADAAGYQLKRKFPQSALDADLLAACQQAAKAHLNPLDNEFQPEKKPEVPDNLSLLILEILKILCRQHGVADSLVGSRKEISSLVEAILQQKDMKGNPVAIGWRWELFGQPIADYLAGKSAVKWAGGQLELVYL